MISSSETVTGKRQIARIVLGLWLALVTFSAAFRAAAPIQYRFTFPEPEHHWMQVEVTFSELGPGPLELRMSRSSPGRYSLHDFAKNVYDVSASGADGRPLAVVRADPHGWTIAGHNGAARVLYKVFGDRVDGTYLGIDPTHAHINMPAAIAWGRGLEDRPATLTFVQPAGQKWQVATQLQPGSHPLEFTAPNFQYLMDSPVEFGPLAVRQFTVNSGTIRLALHHTGTDAELDRFVGDVEKIVRQQLQIYEEFPAYEPGFYTFLADYLPYATGDGMEHRNSTVITSSSSLRSNAFGLLDTVAHEFFHGWNVERIRPRSLEPFDFERANQSGELWLAEGFTQYYGPLTLSRAGLSDVRGTAATMGAFANAVAANSAHLVRSAEEMSQMAVFTDGGRSTDRTNWPSTVISYYSHGAAIALALDLSLRERSNGRVSLDDFMRAMWRAHGKPGGTRPGYVDRPYSIADAERQLAAVSGDQRFARDFFARYIQGREVADYGRLVAQAGLVLRKRNPNIAWLGDVRFDAQGGALRVGSPPAFGSPAYKAGIDLGDEIREVDGRRVSSADDVRAALSDRRPGDTVAVTYVNRSGTPQTRTVTLGEDPAVQLVTLESTGGALTDAQRAFRKSWLGQ
jgi:predicted metalloprotease with PDZ domain